MREIERDREREGERGREGEEKREEEQARKKRQTNKQKIKTRYSLCFQYKFFDCLTHTRQNDPDWDWSPASVDKP